MTGKCSPAYTAIDYATSGGSSLVIRNFLNLDDDPVILIRHRFEFGQENAGGARAPRRDGLAGTGRLLDRFHRHLSDRSDRGTRFPRPGLAKRRRRCWTLLTSTRRS
jgi:hypothetical protein